MGVSDANSMRSREFRPNLVVESGPKTLRASCRIVATAGGLTLVFEGLTPDSSLSSSRSCNTGGR